MPLYEFRCKKCSHVFERLCRMGENGKSLACEHCGAKAPQRLMSVCATRVSGGNGGEAHSTSKCGGCSSHHCATCH